MIQIVILIFFKSVYPVFATTPEKLEQKAFPVKKTTHTYIERLPQQYLRPPILEAPLKNEESGTNESLTFNIAQEMKNARVFLLFHQGNFPRASA